MHEETDGREISGLNVGPQGEVSLEGESEPSMLRSIVEGTNTSAGRLFDVCIQTLIILSLVTFSLDTLPNLPARLERILKGFEVFTVAIFTAEYFLRLALARKKLRFVFSFYGLVDLLAVAPFYLTYGIDLRALRMFRLFRLFRILKLLRFSRALQRMGLAFSKVRNELTVFLIATAFTLFAAATGIYYFENPAQPEAFASIFHSLWWAVCTLTTVGYGEVYPITVGGKIFTVLILMVGLGVVAVPTGLISSALTEMMSKEKGDGGS